MTKRAKTCRWTWDADGFYRTACEQEFCFIESREKEFKFCPYCGRRIRWFDGGRLKSEA